MMARKDFVAVQFPMFRWGGMVTGGVSLEAMWHKKVNTNSMMMMMMRRTLKIFQPPKVHAAQDEAKTGGAALSLLGGMDDG